ncbi:MAG: ThiF family adenylyltransferase [Cyclobacteriaceae bacterium]
MSELFLHKYLPIHKVGDVIQVGFGKRFLEISYTSENLSLLQEAIQDGVSDTEIVSSDIYMKLYEKGMLGERQDKQRQQHFLDYLEVPFDDEIYDIPILVLGAGAGGSTLVYLLAQTGFKNLWVVDADNVELSEVEKTMVYRKDDIGKPKIRALKEIVSHNHGITLHTIEEMVGQTEHIRSLINTSDAELVVKACDPDPAFRLHLNEACWQEGIPFIHMAYAYEVLKVGPFFIPGATGCDECFMHKLGEMEGKKDYHYNSQQRLFSEHQTHPSVNFNINMLGSIILKDVLFFILGKYEYVQSLGQQVNVRSLTGTDFTISVPAECSRCK